jgi:peroxiredoxin
MADAAPKIGDVAPEFAVMNQDKKVVKLSELRGKKVVLLFYPMDFSPTCTEEHCTFGPRIGEIAPDDKTVVFGVSCDSPYTHAAFRKQYSIPYDLLADTSRRMSKAYGMFAGEEPYNSSKRGTVIIDGNGRIAQWVEQPMREARRVEQLAQEVRGEAAERANFGGTAHD